jgi:ornithine cyclodeaminase/alanine dehydrogenase-like protein (mu-crystallin family)
MPIERGIIHWDQIRELSDVVAGHIPGRQSAEDITLFESQGLAIEDMAVAARVYHKALEEGVGQEIG